MQRFPVLLERSTLWLWHYRMTTAALGKFAQLPLKEEDTVVVADFSILDVRPGQLNPETVHLAIVGCIIG